MTTHRFGWLEGLGFALAGGVGAYAYNAIRSSKASAAGASPAAAAALPPAGSSAEGTVVGFEVVRDYALPFQNAMSLRGATDENFLGGFPGNPLEIMIRSTSGSSAGQRGTVLAAGQTATDRGTVMASIAYAPRPAAASDPKVQANDYSRLAWMPPEGTMVELGKNDVRQIMANDGTIIH